MNREEAVQKLEKVMPSLVAELDLTLLRFENAPGFRYILEYLSYKFLCQSCNELTISQGIESITHLLCCLINGQQCESKYKIVMCEELIDYLECLKEELTEKA